MDNICFLTVRQLLMIDDTRCRRSRCWSVTRRKQWTSTRDDHSLRKTVKQCRLKMLGELDEGWSWSQFIESHHTQIRNRLDLSHSWYQAGPEPSGMKGLIWAKEERSALLLFLKIKVPESGWRVDKLWIHAALNKSCMKFLQSVVIWSHVMCWCPSIVFHQVLSWHSRLILKDFIPTSFPSSTSHCSESQQYCRLVCWPSRYCAWCWSAPLTWRPKEVYFISRERW